jgi:hypothetical protein
MATKAQRYLATVIVERSVRNATGRPKQQRSKKVVKAHNLSERAGRAARVGYEASSGRPSRKSTRGSARHQRAGNQLERTNQLGQSAPEARVRLTRARAVKVRGKPH